MSHPFPSEVMLSTAHGRVRVVPDPRLSPDEALVRGPIFTQSYIIPFEPVAAAVSNIVGEHVSRWNDDPTHVRVHPIRFGALVEETSSRFFFKIKSNLPPELHAATGRPALFEIQRDWALEAGNKAALAEVDRASELWNRSPEEWELERVDLRPWPFCITVAAIMGGTWLQVGNHAVNAEALRRLLNHWPSMERYFAAIGFEIRRAPRHYAFDLRPLPRPVLFASTPRRQPAHPLYDLSPRDEGIIIDRALDLLGYRGRRAVEVASVRSQAVTSLQFLAPELRTPAQLAAQLAAWMEDPRAQALAEQAAREREYLARMRYGGAGAFRREYLGEFVTDEP